MAQTPEGKAKAEIRKWLTDRGVWFAGRPKPHFVWGWMYQPVPTPLGAAGIPDFCGIIAGKPFYIEAKAPTNGTVSENQKDRHEEIRLAGGHVVVATCAKDVEDYLFKYGFI